MTRATPSPEPESERRETTERSGLLGRRLLPRGPTPEERLAQFIEERRREFDAQTARFETTLAEIEQRELLLSDAKASIERLLRLGSKELDAREAELVGLMDQLVAREARVHEQEEELAARRGELGAVELKRLVLEQRERALDAREAAVATAEEQVEAESAAEEETGAATLAFVPGPAYRLVEVGPLPVEPGKTVLVEGAEWELLRVGPSPLPGDDRRCAYLVRGPRLSSPSGGSS